MATLVDLPDDVKKRLYVVHTTVSQVPIDKGLFSCLFLVLLPFFYYFYSKRILGLRAAPSGVKNTLILDVNMQLSEVIQVLDLLSSVLLFRFLSLLLFFYILLFILSLTL